MSKVAAVVLGDGYLPAHMLGNESRGGVSLRLVGEGRDKDLVARSREAGESPGAD